MKTGLVMEGGGMRGMYTAGVIDIFLENNIEFDGAIGVSAGAVFGCNYKSKQIGRVIRYNKKYCNDARYVSLKNWIKTGNLYSEDFAYKEVPLNLDPFDQKTFAENKMEFYAVCTDAKTGKAVYHLCESGDENDMKWLRGSAAVPVLSKPVIMGNYDLVDGGVSDSIPILWFKNRGYEKNVIVLTRPLNYRKEKIKILPLLKVISRKYPNMVEAIGKRHIGYNKTLYDIQALEKEGSVFVIRPSEAIVTSLIEKKPENLEKIYQLGRKDAFKYLQEVVEFLKEKN